MASRVEEVELKYDVTDDVELPSFDDLDGVASVSAPAVHKLQATYYDTVDHRLAAGRIALRRRKGGEDEGWHLKEEATADTRLETRTDLGRVGDGVPDELAALVRSRSRRRQLVPIATIENRRTVRRLLDGDGSVLAEVADDRVTAQPLGGAELHASSWREVEVELVGGDRDLLTAAGQRLEAAGARPASWGSKLARTIGDTSPRTPHAIALGPGSTAGDVVTAHLAAQVDALVSLDPLVRQDQHDSVHKMRVATRRLRSALATFRRLLDRSVTDPLRDELKWLGGVLGAARDTEVIHARLRELLDAEDDPRGPISERIDSTMRARYEAAHREVIEVLDGARYLQLLDDLDAVASGEVITGQRAGRAGRKTLRKDVRRALRHWQREVDALEDADDGNTQLHEVRKKAKRVRYAGEAVAPVLGARAERLATRMEELQDVLGRHQDGMVTAHVIAGLAEEASAAGEDTFTYGRLHAVELCDAGRAAAAGQELIEDLSGSRPGWLR